ncbi:MAG: TlpA disulfide reductase family protein [bacterium]|nr:TlpA disulfide reductase family protein [bacterium]
MKKLLIIASLIFLTNISFSQELIKANQHTLDSIKTANAGKVILINFWATWCKPCVEEFPDLMKIREDYKDKDFKLVFVSLDFGDDLETQTQKFLKKMGVDFVTYTNGFNKDEELINYVDKDWNGGIPGTFIYDKKGALKKSIVGKTKYKDFKNAIDKYLKGT